MGGVVGGGCGRWGVGEVGGVVSGGCGKWGVWKVGVCGASEHLPVPLLQELGPPLSSRRQRDDRPHGHVSGC